MDNIKVFRIQHRENGCGCFWRTHYNIGDLIYNMLIRHNDFNDPSEDKLDLRKNNSSWYCAYKSIQQLRKWITDEEVRYLILNGFDILELTVSDYQVGKDQIIFTKESITDKKVLNNLFI